MKPKFAIELVINYPETIEKRVWNVLSKIKVNDNIVRSELSDLDATGLKGFHLSTRLESNKIIEVGFSELQELLTGDGQVFELSLSLFSNHNYYKLLITDGTDADILSNAFYLLDKNIIGEFKYLDLNLFLL